MHSNERELRTILREESILWFGGKGWIAGGLWAKCDVYSKLAYEFEGFSQAGLKNPIFLKLVPGDF